MKTWKVFIGLGAVAALAWSAGAYTQQLGGAQKLSLEDYLEIQQVYFAYSRSVDPGATEDAASLFTSDGAFIRTPDPGKRPGERIAGGKDLKAFYTKIKDDHYAGTRHITSNLLIRRTAEGAKVSSYLLTVERKEAAGPATILEFGTYDDTLVKTPAGWRFKQRIFAPDSYTTAPR